MENSQKYTPEAQALIDRLRQQCTSHGNSAIMPAHMMLELSQPGTKTAALIEEVTGTDTIEQLRHEIAVPGPERIFFLADGIRAGMTDEELHELSAIDPWFLNQVREIVETEDKLRGNPLSAFTKSDMLFLLSLIHISEPTRPY